MSDTAASTSYHAAQFVASGGSSSITVDNRSTVTGAGGSSTSGTGASVGDNVDNGSALNGIVCEGGIILGHALSAPEIASMHTNQSSRYGTP